MTRALIPLSLLALSFATVACNPADAKDKNTVWTNLQPLDDEGQVHGRGIRINAGVDAQARDMEIETEIGATTTRMENEQPRLDIYKIETISDVIEAFDGRSPPDARASDGSADLDVNPNFQACEGDAFTIRSDGGCDWELQLLILGDGPRDVFVNGSVKIWASDEWSGDPESIGVYFDVTALEPEESEEGE